LLAILRKSKANNPALGVTGVLCFRGHLPAGPRGRPQRGQPPVQPHRRRPRHTRLLKARPRTSSTPKGVRTVFAEAKAGRRDFIRSAFAAAVAGDFIRRRRRRRRRWRRPTRCRPKAATRTS
jgi:hypothetical protein